MPATSVSPRLPKTGRADRPGLVHPAETSSPCEDIVAALLSQKAGTLPVPSVRPLKGTQDDAHHVASCPDKEEGKAHLPQNQ